MKRNELQRISFVDLQKCRNRERTIDAILEDMNRLSKLYSIQEFNPIVEYSKESSNTDSKDPITIQESK